MPTVANMHLKIAVTNRFSRIDKIPDFDKNRPSPRIFIISYGKEKSFRKNGRRNDKKAGREDWSSWMTYKVEFSMMRCTLKVAWNTCECTEQTRYNQKAYISFEDYRFETAKYLLTWDYMWPIKIQWRRKSNEDLFLLTGLTSAYEGNLSPNCYQGQQRA